MDPVGSSPVSIKALKLLFFLNVHNMLIRLNMVFMFAFLSRVKS